MGFKLNIPVPIELSFDAGHWFISIEEFFIELTINVSDNDQCVGFQSKTTRALFQEVKALALQHDLISSDECFSIRINVPSEHPSLSETYLKWVLLVALCAIHQKNFSISSFEKILEVLPEEDQLPLLRSSYLGGLSVWSNNWSIKEGLRIPFSSLLFLSRIKKLNLQYRNDDLKYRQVCFQQGLTLNKPELIAKGLIPFDYNENLSFLNPKNTLGVLPLNDHFDLIIFSDSNTQQTFIKNAPSEWEPKALNINAEGIVKK